MECPYCHQTKPNPPGRPAETKSKYSLEFSKEGNLPSVYMCKSYEHIKEVLKTHFDIDMNLIKIMRIAKNMHTKTKKYEHIRIKRLF